MSVFTTFSVVKVTVNYVTKGDVKPNEEELKIGKQKRDRLITSNSDGVYEDGLMGSTKTPLGSLRYERISQCYRNEYPGRCAACKSQRRKCPQDCIFSPYFPPNDPQRFACVHRIYGCSNVGKMLQQMPVQMRAQAVGTLYMEARWRIEDPVYGCVKFISQLHQNLDDTESELAKIKALIAFHKLQISQVNELHQPNLDASQSNVEQFQFNYSTQNHYPWFIN